MWLSLIKPRCARFPTPDCYANRRVRGEEARTNEKVDGRRKENGAPAARVPTPPRVHHTSSEQLSDIPCLSPFSSSSSFHVSLVLSYSHCLLLFSSFPSLHLFGFCLLILCFSPFAPGSSSFIFLSSVCPPHFLIILFSSSPLPHSHPILLPV